MANKRIKRKVNSCGGGAMSAGIGATSGRRYYAGSNVSSAGLVTPSLFHSSVGRITVREQLTAIRGATKPNSGSHNSFSKVSLSTSGSQFSSNRGLQGRRLQRLQPASTKPAVANQFCLNRCYSSQGANLGVEVTADPMSNNSSKLNLIQHSSLPNPPAQVQLTAHLKYPNKFCSPALIMENKTFEKNVMNKDQCIAQKNGLKATKPIQSCTSEECEADHEVALINSSFGIVTPSKASSKRKRLNRNSPRFIKSIRKLRLSPRLNKSPANLPNNLQQSKVPIQKKGKRNLKSSSPFKDEYSNRREPNCLDALIERQNMLKKIVVTLKRKPHPLTNLKKALDQARKVKEEIHSFNDCLNEQFTDLNQLICSTPDIKDEALINPIENPIMPRKFETESSAEIFSLKEEFEQIHNHEFLKTNSDSNLPPSVSDSFDDLIPEEFMMDETDILGISLDNISAFGDDNFNEHDFDEETRSSFPEETTNVHFNAKLNHIGCNENAVTSTQNMADLHHLSVRNIRCPAGDDNCQFKLNTDANNAKGECWTHLDKLVSVEENSENGGQVSLLTNSGNAPVNKKPVRVIYNYNNNRVTVPNPKIDVSLEGECSVAGDYLEDLWQTQFWGLSENDAVASTRRLTSGTRSTNRTPNFADFFSNISCTSSARMDSPLLFLNPSPSDEISSMAS